MTTAGAVAIELRRVADALDKEPETPFEQPMVSFYCNDYLAADKGKTAFLNVVRLLPKPLTKKPSDTVMELEYKTDAILLRAQIDRSAVCTLVEPAKPAVYRCEPLLSQDEEAALRLESESA